MAKYTQTSDAKKGGMFTGKSHDEGGIPAIVTDTGQPIEVEGGEAIINKEATKLHCKELSEINQSAGNGVPIPCPDEAEEIAKRFETGGKITLKDKKKVFDKWRKLVNMTHTELRRYYHSNEGKKSGLSKEEADEQGISSGRESAEWILKMKKTNWKNWSNDMWKWANKQISFISRMRGNKGDLYDEKGKKTRKLMSLLIWGHNPKKYREPVFNDGGKTPEKKKSKAIKFVDNIDYSEYYIDNEPELIEDAKKRLTIFANYIKFDRVEGKYDWEAPINENNPPLIAYENFYLDNNLVLASHHYWDQPAFENEKITEILTLYPDNNNEEFSVTYHWTSYDRIDIKDFEKQVKEIFTSPEVIEILNDNVYSAVVSVEGYEEYSEEFNTEKEARIGIQDIKANTKFQVVKGEVAVSDRIEQDNVIETFKGGGKPDEEELIAIHNLNFNNIVEADKLGALITPSIAILKPNMDFNQFGYITLIGSKELIDPANKYSVKVFSGDVYSPSVPRKMYYYSKRDAEAFATNIVKKAYNYQRSTWTKNNHNNSLGNYVDNKVGEISEWYKRLGNYSSKENQNNYYDDFKIVYLLENNIPFPIPLKNTMSWMFNNVPFNLTPDQIAQGKKIYQEYKKNDFQLPENLKSTFYDLMIASLKNYFQQYKSQYENKGLNAIDLEIIAGRYTDLLKTFEREYGTKEENWSLNHLAYKFAQFLYPRKELDTEKLKIVINKIIKKNEAEYKEWLKDFMDQWQGSGYFLQGREKIAWTLNNLVDATSGATRGQEDTMTYGLNKARAFGLKQFTSVADIKSKAHKLLSSDEVNAIQKEQSDRFIELADKFKYADSSQWRKLDDFGKVIADYLKGSSISRALSKNGFTDPYDYKSTLEEFIKEVKVSPVDYFEAKMQRGVKLSEFQYAVVPKKDENVSKDYYKQVQDILKRNNVKIAYYSSPEERTEIIAEITKKKKLRFEDGGLLRNVELNMRRPEKNEIVFVSVDALLEKHAKDQPSYDITNPENRIKGRVEKAKEFIKNYIKDQRAINTKTGERMNYKVSFEPSVVDIDANGKISFEDGRHRVLAAKEFGLTEVPIEVPKEKVKAVKELLAKKYHLGGDMKKHLAPNGKPSNLTHNQWHIVRTPEFYGWFGFWDLFIYSKANDYYDPKIREITKKLKEENAEAIQVASDFLMRQVTENDVLISMPSRSGCPTDTKKLAEAIAEKTGAKVFNCLIGDKRKSIYDLKKSGENISKFDFGFEIKDDIPKGQKYFIVDNVIGTGTTMKNAMLTVQSIVGENVFPLVYSIDLNNISKVVDENGEPLVVYHGTYSKFNIFDKNELGMSQGRSPANMYGFYFTENRNVAQSFGKYLKAFFIKIKKPKTIDIKGGDYSQAKFIVNDFVKNISSKYDGAILFNYKDSGENKPLLSNQYIVPNSYQIKLADGTNSTFDQNNPDIRYETGGLFHGSPHKFKKFTTDAMGTGEGSQAYGWGLYFTSLRDVANWYAQKLGDVKIKILKIGDFLIFKDDRVVGYDTAKNETEVRIAEWFAVYESEIKYPVLSSQSKEEAEERVSLEIKRTLDEFIETEIDNLESDPEYFENSVKIASVLKKQPVQIEFESNRYIYEVTYNKGKKAPDNWLLWDKAPDGKILNLLLKNNVDAYNKFYKPFLTAEVKKDGSGYGVFDRNGENITGERLPDYESAMFVLERNKSMYYKKGKEIYEEIQTKLKSDKDASLFLKSIGIDGIKFPAESKGDEARGFNYVVFDDSKLTIDKVSTYSSGGQIDMFGGVVEPKQYAKGSNVSHETITPEKDVYEAGNLQVRNIGGNYTYYKKVNKRWEFLDADELQELMLGQKHELEHNDTMKAFMRNEIPKEIIASSIAWEHIQETPDYYEKLEKAIPEKMAKGKLLKESLNLLIDNIGIDRSKIPLGKESEQIYVGQFKASNKDLLEVYVSEVNLSDYVTDWEGRTNLKEEFVRKIVAKNEKAQVTLTFSEKYNKIKLYYLDSSSSKYFHELSKKQKTKGKDIKKYLDLGVQNLSYGTDLLKLFIKQADAKGIEKIVAHDTSAFGSEKFWEKMGFAPDEYREHDYVLILNPEEYAKGDLIKRADGSYSPRGLWDNIRANIGSGRKPTTEMLEQEEKIKSRQKDMFDDGGKTEITMENENQKGVVTNYLDTPVTYRNVKAVRPETMVISPYDKKFMSICNKFAGTDGLRPAMTGVFFEKDQATVTDAHKLLHVATTKTDFEGIYPTDNTIKNVDESIKLNAEQYPNWRAVIPQGHEAFEVDTMKFYQYVKVAVNYANKTTYQIEFKYNNERIAMNGQFLLTCLEGLMKIQKCPKLFLNISTPTRAVIISYKARPSKESDTWCLVMPQMSIGGGFLGEYGAFNKDYNTGLSAYFDISKNQIFNGDNTIAKYQETYDQGNEMPSSLIAMFKKIIDAKSKLPITETLCVKGGEITAFSFKSSESVMIQIPNDYNLSEGCYSIVNNGLQFNVGYNVDDFPKYKDRPSSNDQMLSMPTNAFKYYFAQTTKHIGDDELRPALSAVLIQKRGKLIKFVGTDAHTLCQFNVSGYVTTNQKEDFDLMISNADAINSFMQSVDVQEIKLYWNDVDFRIDAGRLQLQSKFIYGKYPNYEAVIPKIFENTVEFDVKEMMQCLKSTEIKEFSKKEKNKIDDIGVLNVGNKIYAVRDKSSGYNNRNDDSEIETADQICTVNIKKTKDGGQIDLNDSLVILMPIMFNYENERAIMPTEFYFKVDKLKRTMETLGSDVFKAYYTDLNKAYVLTSKQMDFSKADLPKEVKEKETKPKLVYKAEPKPKIVYKAEPKPKSKTKMFTYALTSRPFDIGTYPKENFVRYVEEEDKNYTFGLLEYSQPVPLEDIKHYSLAPVSEILGLDKIYFDYYNGYLAQAFVKFTPNNIPYLEVITYDEDQKTENERKNLTGYEFLNNLRNGNYKITTPEKLKKQKLKTVGELSAKQKISKPVTNKKDIEDAIKGAEAYLKYVIGTKEVSDIIVYIRGLKILLK